MRSKLVVGNWKLHGSREFTAALLAELTAVKLPAAVEVAVCPPYVYLPQAIEVCANTAIRVGAQNASEHEQGAFTGEVSCGMLAELGAHYVLVGHSERRELYADTDAVVVEKFAAVQKQGLIPILCVGESLQQRQDGLSTRIVLSQLDAVVDKLGIEALAMAVLAYEPIWAIGTGETASPEQAQEIHAAIRQHVAEKDTELAASLRILYGGSVKSSNSAELFAQSDIDGGLVGGASLEAEQFIAICESADN